MPTARGRALQEPATTTVDEQDPVTAARERLEWIESPEYAKARRAWLPLSMFVLSATAVGAAVGAFTLPSSGGFAGAGAGLGGSCYIGAYVFLLLRRRQRRQWRDRRLLAQAREKLEAAEAAVLNTADERDATDFASLWTATQRRLDYYHEIATGQARQSFAIGLVAAGVGMSVILGCAIIAAFAKETAATVAASLLGVSGGGLAGYVGTTFMRMHEKASDQLRAYFLQPLEFSRTLAAERLLVTIDRPEERTRAVQVLIESLAHGRMAPDDASPPSG